MASMHSLLVEYFKAIFPFCGFACFALMQMQRAWLEVFQYVARRFSGALLILIDPGGCKESGEQLRGNQAHLQLKLIEVAT